MPKPTIKRLPADEKTATQILNEKKVRPQTYNNSVAFYDKKLRKNYILLSQ